MKWEWMALITARGIRGQGPASAVGDIVRSTWSLLVADFSSLALVNLGLQEVANLLDVEVWEGEVWEKLEEREGEVPGGGWGWVWEVLGGWEEGERVRGREEWGGVLEVPGALWEDLDPRGEATELEEVTGEVRRDDVEEPPKCKQCSELLPRICRSCSTEELSFNSWKAGEKTIYIIMSLHTAL